MALNEHKQVNRVGTMHKDCSKIMDPVTFSSSDSYIPILNWTDYPKFYSFSLEFQTNERNGILAYILGAQNDATVPANSSLVSLSRDFFSLEIHDKFLNAYINLGSKYSRHEITNERVSSGRSHQVSVVLNPMQAIIRFDQSEEKIINFDNANNNDKLDLVGPLVIGGIYPSHVAPPSANPSLRLPPYFYSGMLGHGFVGCIQDVEVNGHYVNLTHFAALEGVSGISTEICAPMPDQCDLGNCLNEGVCLDGWNRFYCDCSSTGFNGPTCNQRKSCFRCIYFHSFVEKK